MAERCGFDPVIGTWNDSLTGDYFWSRNNFGEARPDVMSPFTYSITEKVWTEISFLPGYHLSGNICGRYYANVSVSISMLQAMGKSKDAAIAQIQDLLGNAPAELEVPTVPLSRWTMLLALPRMIVLGPKERRGRQQGAHIHGAESRPMPGAAPPNTGDSDRAGADCHLARGD